MSASKLFQKVDDFTVVLKFPFKIRPLSADDHRIPFSVVEVAGLKLKKYGKVTAQEAGILQAFRFDHVREITNFRVKIATFLKEMSAIFKVDTVEEMWDLMGDADKLKVLKEDESITFEVCQEWTDRWRALHAEYEGDQIQIIRDMDLITFIVAMRGENPDWDYVDTYSILTSEGLKEVLDFLYEEEGLNAEDSEEPKKP